jgi:hypothetical protein
MEPEQTLPARFVQAFDLTPSLLGGPMCRESWYMCTVLLVSWRQLLTDREVEQYGIFWKLQVAS